MANGPLFYTYKAACHCPTCAAAELGADLDNPDKVFSDGTTVGAVFPWETGDWTDGASCDQCGRELVEVQPDRGAWTGDETDETDEE